MDDALHATRLWMVKQALAATNGNKAEAARRLGISRRTLYNILEADGTQGA